MQSLAINVECSPLDKYGKKIGPIKKIVLLDPNIKVAEATRILLEKFGLTNDKDATTYAICLRKDSDGKTKYLIPDVTRVVGSCLNTKVFFLFNCHSLSVFIFLLFSYYLLMYFVISDHVGWCI